MLRLWLSLIGAASLALVASSAFALPTDDTQAFGDHGDGPYRDVCSSGQYMTGVRVRSGLWIDQISVTCSTIIAGGGLTNPISLTPRGGQTGSPPYGRDCPANSLIMAIDVATLDNRRVSALKFLCRLPTNPATTAVFTTGNPKDTFGNPPRLRSCPTGEAAVGLQGGYGKDVNSAGLVCARIVVPIVARPPPPISPVPNSQTPTTAAPYNNKVLQYAKDHLSQKLGQGQCTDLVVAALAYAGAKPGDFSSRSGDYVWGRRLNLWSETPQPGDIVQLVAATLTYTTPNSHYTWSTSTQHSAIIESVTSGRQLNVIEQNAPPGDPVERGVINLNWTLVSGSYKIYRPVSP